MSLGNPRLILASVTGAFLLILPTQAHAQQPSASTCDIARRQGRTVPGCTPPAAQRPTPSTTRVRDARQPRIARTPAAPRLTRASIAMRDALDAVPAAHWSRASDFMQLEMQIDALGSAADLRALAESGHARAFVILGLAYQNDELGLGMDGRAACREYQRAAEAGDPQGQHRAGLCYLNGSSVPRDYARARQFLELAMGQGNPAATGALAVIYREGLGVQRDPVRADALAARARATPN